mgnify:CR=1 FL=1
MVQSVSNCTLFDLGNLDTSQCVSLKRLFSSCYNATDVRGLEKWDTSKIKNFVSCFDGMRSLDEIPGISNWNTQSCQDFTSVFYNCYHLKRVDISGWSDESCNAKAGSLQHILFGSTSGGYPNLQYVKIGSNWRYVTDLLSDTNAGMGVTGADGKWYAASDGKGYTPADIPSNKADIYYASKDFLPKMTGNIQISGSNSPGSTLSAIVEGVPSNANIGYQWYIGVGSKDFEYVVTDIFVDDAVRDKVGEATLSDKDVILFKGEETASYSIDAEIINSSGAVVFKKTFNENSNSAYFKPSESGVYKVKVRLTSGSTYFEATKRALEFEKIDGETSQSLNILDNQEYRTFMCKAFDKSGKYLGEISSEKVTITPKAKLLK